MSKSSFWQIDKVTFEKIQQLKLVVDFIATLEFTTTEQKVAAQEIKLLIENIDKPEYRKDWCVGLDIFDFEIQSSKRKEGFYWRRWYLCFEDDFLNIIAESRHTAKAEGHYGNDFSFFASIYFGNSDSMIRIQFDNDIYSFIKDIKSYKKYITDNLNELEIDIEVF